MPIEQLPWPSIGIGSGWLFVGIAVWMIYNGRLLTRSGVERELNQYKEHLDRVSHEANEWRTEGRIKDQQILEKDIQLRHLEELGRTVHRLLDALQSRVLPQSKDEEL